MTSLTHFIPPLVPHIACGGICPSCSGSVYRIQRRPFDRFVNFFVPVHRYRCGSLGCRWEGNLLVPQEVLQN